MHISELPPRRVSARAPDACPARRQAETVRVVGLTYRQAEGLLDWLENHGCTEVEVEPDEAGRFPDRPPGRVLSLPSLPLVKPRCSSSLVAAHPWAESHLNFGGP